MAKKVLNDSESYEHLCTIKMDSEFKRKFPICYQNKLEELMEENGLTEEEAVNVMKDTEIELELYYEKGAGLFAVECDAVESGSIFSPYTKDEYTDPEWD